MDYDYKNNNCIVAGGSGFIGQNLVKKLIGSGASVYVIDNFSYGALRSNIDKEARVLEGDIRDFSIFGKLPKIKYDYFFHFAAPSSTVLFDKDQEECADITIRGFLNCVQFCAKNGVRLTFPSSGNVYGGIKPPHTESSFLNDGYLGTYSKTKYARAKLATEAIQKAYAEKCNSLGLRIFAGYGPGEVHKVGFESAIYQFCKKMIDGEKPVIYGDGNQKRDFIYIDDLADAILILAKKSNEPIVNVGSGEAVSFNDIIKIINNTLGIDVGAVYVGRPSAYVEQTMADTKILRKYFNKPNHSINEGIRHTIDYIKNL